PGRARIRFFSLVRMLLLPLLSVTPYCRSSFFVCVVGQRTSGGEVGWSTVKTTIRLLVPVLCTRCPQPKRSRVEHAAPPPSFPRVPCITLRYFLLPSHRPPERRPCGLMPSVGTSGAHAPPTKA
ncbi:unnamed protein product, partial [Ectocarpus sp. 12 AP-2014]